MHNVALSWPETTKPDCVKCASGENVLSAAPCCQGAVKAQYATTAGKQWKLVKFARNITNVKFTIKPTRKNVPFVASRTTVWFCVAVCVWIATQRSGTKNTPRCGYGKRSEKRKRIGGGKNEAPARGGNYYPGKG